MGSYLYKSKNNASIKLLEDNNIVFVSGDILLVESSELEICMGGHAFDHIGIVTFTNFNTYVFHNGNFENLREYLFRHDRIQIRCIKQPFDQYVLTDVCKKVQNFMMTSNTDIFEREGLSASLVLQEMGMLTKTIVSPHLFELECLCHDNPIPLPPGR
jgi:hypothetical protein